MSTPVSTTPKEPVERHPWLLRCHPLVCAFLWAIFFLLGPVKVVGRYRVPKTGALLILANHRADVDPPVIWYASSRPIHFMAKSELFEIRVLGKFIRWCRAFSVKRGEPDRQAIRHAVNLLKAGECVCVFPEGQLSETGELQPILPGAALIARMAGVPILCCGVVGTERMMPYGTVTPRPAFGGVRITWGTVKQFEKGVEIEEIVEWATSQLRELTS